MEQFSLSFPCAPRVVIRAALSLSVYLSIYLPPVFIFLSHSFFLSLLSSSSFQPSSLSLHSSHFFVPLVNHPPIPSPFTLLPSRLLSLPRHHVVALSDMSLCYRHNQLALSSRRSSSRVLVASHSLLPRPTLSPPRVICNVSYARAPPRSSAISAIILIFMPIPSSLRCRLVAHSLALACFLSLVARGDAVSDASRGKANRKRIHRTLISLNCSTLLLIDPHRSKDVRTDDSEE